jgi:ribosome-associated protein YbcJ (S4-like RNA binding protein)
MKNKEVLTLVNLLKKHTVIEDGGSKFKNPFALEKNEAE